MSYAYIKSVYPDFEAKKIYDDKIYNTLEPVTQPLPDKDNLKFYNIPLPDLPIQNKIETFESSDKCKLECNDYVQHILNCEGCKTMLSKQLGLDNNRQKNEEFMELFSYILFGIFVLILLDKYKNNS